MGLCKCPKKKVTNLFCFEHRVNVCESCLVSHHAKCVVQSYLQWLQDSDYDPSCPLCQSDIACDSQRECVRLMCYDLFHWECLNLYAQQLPENTAPAGYVCPRCQLSIFPASNVQSPVAEVLRSVLSRVNWARAGLGLPLIDEHTTAVPKASPVTSDQSHSSISLPDGNHPTHTRPSAQVPPYTSTPIAIKPYLEHSVLDMDTGAQARNQVEPRKLFSDTDANDHDVDKYKRRSAFTWLARWFKSRETGAYRKPISQNRKFLYIAVFVLIALCTVIIVFSRLGAYMTENDPLLDPHANPNVRIDLDDE